MRRNRFADTGIYTIPGTSRNELRKQPPWMSFEKLGEYFINVKGNVFVNIEKTES